MDENTQEQPVEEVVQDSQEPQLPVDNARVEEGAEQFAEPEAEPATAESILSVLLTDLEGIAHMAKSEIEAVVAAAREKFNTL